MKSRFQELDEARQGEPTREEQETMDRARSRGSDYDADAEDAGAER